MNKKIAALLLCAIFAAGFIYAQEENIDSGNTEPVSQVDAGSQHVFGTEQEKKGTELIFSGEMKTGIYWERVQYENRDYITEDEEKVVIGNNDGDSGFPGEGRFRLNMHLVNHDLNMGVKLRYQQTDFTSPTISMEFAFAYANLFNDQIRISIGKLGESPWSAGGPDIWQEIDNHVGIRTEFIPSFLPGLNFGFVLNDYGGPAGETLYYYDRDDIWDLLSESVLGIAYTNKYFHGRFSWRFDGIADIYNDYQMGMEMMYRLEERILRNYVNGLEIWMNGWWKGIGPDDRVIKDEVMNYRNIMYIKYAPSFLNSELRLWMDFLPSRIMFKPRLAVYYNIFSWLYAGAAVNMDYEMGERKTLEGVPYQLLGIEPQIRFSFDNGYVALVYNYEWNYVREATPDPVLKETQKLNLRLVLNF